MELLGIAFLIFGLSFFFVGVLGVIRLPDAFSRLHASCKVETLGLFGLLVGAALLEPSTALRLLALGLFVLLTSPVATHAIAASVYRRREIAQQLKTESSSEDDQNSVEGKDSSINVTAVLSRSRMDEIVDAMERAKQWRDRSDD